VLNYTFFRGKKAQLLGEPLLDPSDTIVTVTVVQDGKPDKILKCPGKNLFQIFNFYMY
jgi:hypothetical protein